jgi:hypothetical protein
MIGAPQAFETGLATYVDTTKPRFAKGVPKGARAKIREILGPLPFRSFVAIPIVHPSGTLGVVNVETSEPYLLGEGPEVMNGVIKCLYPYCTLLGHVLASSGTYGAD